MAGAQNDDELAAMFEKPFKIAAQNIAAAIYDLNVSTIESVVYDAYIPQFYNRTGEFAEAWKAEAESEPYKATAKVEFDPTKLTPGSNDINSSNYGQHVSAQSGQIVRDGLADIIYQGLAGPTFGWPHGGYSGRYHQARNAYKELVKILGKQKINNIVRDGLRAAGFSVKSHGGISMYED